MGRLGDWETEAGVEQEFLHSPASVADLIRNMGKPPGVQCCAITFFMFQDIFLPLLKPGVAVRVGSQVGLSVFVEQKLETCILEVIQSPNCLDTILVRLGTLNGNSPTTSKSVWDYPKRCIIYLDSSNGPFFRRPIPSLLSELYVKIISRQSCDSR